jgi:hypothetical protein
MLFLVILNEIEETLVEIDDFDRKPLFQQDCR